MMKISSSIVRPLLRKFGYDLVRYNKRNSSAICTYSEHCIKTYDRVKPFTMTSLERINAAIDAIQYVEHNNISGAIVECGVWKGGSSMAMALTLRELGSEGRDLYLYDTFAGMSAPTDADVSIRGANAHEKFSLTQTSDDSSDWCLSSLDEVRENVLSTGYPTRKFHFVEGKVEDTVPATIPDEIAVLRLDTDWYESTKHELIHLFPRLRKGGVLIIDDYGHWEGARRAVDEYIADNNIRILLNRTDYTGRMAIKA